MSDRPLIRSASGAMVPRERRSSVPTLREHLVHDFMELLKHPGNTLTPEEICAGASVLEHYILTGETNLPDKIAAELLKQAVQAKTLAEPKDVPSERREVLPELPAVEERAPE